jgi:rubrerythrin
MDGCGKRENGTDDEGGFMDAGEQITGMRDDHYNLVSVLYHALQGAETTMMYSDDADFEGDDELAQFFQEVQAQDRARARRAKALLRKYLAEES